MATPTAPGTKAMPLTLQQPTPNRLQLPLVIGNPLAGGSVPASGQMYPLGRN